MSEKVNPYCRKFPMAFVEFTGLVTPCCWLVDSKSRHDRLKQFMGDDHDKIFIKHSKETIIKAYNKLEESWISDHPFKTCLEICGENNLEHPLKRIADVKM